MLPSDSIQIPSKLKRDRFLIALPAVLAVLLSSVGVLVAQVAAERIARVCRVRNDTAIAQDGRRLPDEPWLRMRRVDAKKLSHGEQVVAIWARNNGIRLYNTGIT